jgi:hypothetical protein
VAATPARAQRPEADLCIVPPGAQPSLPAKLLPGMRATDMPNGHHGHNVHFLVQGLNLDGRFNDSMTRVRHLMTTAMATKGREAWDKADSDLPHLRQAASAATR